MITSASAWARASSRRNMQFTHAYPRHPSQHTGNTARNLAAPRTSPAHVLRRHNATKPPGSSAPPTTIPGPAWLWLEPVIEPFRAYGRVQQRKPYLTQLVSSLVIYFVGDLVAQGIATPEVKEGEEGVAEENEERGWVQEWSEDRDWARTGRALVIGGISSIPSYKWFLWLSMNFNYGSKILSLTTKVGFSSSIRFAWIR